MLPFLTRACAEARERVRAARARVPDAAVARQAHDAPPAPSFADALRSPGLAVIAEVKRSSPSRGAIADIPDPAALARSYARGGAAAISVLTEPAHFNGSLEDLRRVAAAIGAPVLRKDFIVDAYQLTEARAAGAAAALLIVAALTDAELAELMAAADEVGLDVLVETHTEDQVERAQGAQRSAATGRPLILGVNARDLTTLDVDLGVVARLTEARPSDAILVAESGIRGPQDAANMAALGADAVLVGEHVATAPDPASAVAALRAAGATSPDVVAGPTRAGLR